MKSRLHTRPAGFDRDSIRRQRGFSLIQLLVVVAVVGVVAAIAVPSFLRSAQPMRLRNDAHALANLINMARMRASTEFAHTQVYCTPSPASGPPYCQLRSMSFVSATSTTPTWVTELQTVYLSSGVSFGIPTPTINTPVLNQTSAVPGTTYPYAYQGDYEESMPANPFILFNSRGIPIDPTGVTTNAMTDYALYIKDTTNNYYAVSVNQTGHPTLYWWDQSGKAFTRLYEYSNPNNLNGITQ